MNLSRAVVVVWKVWKRICRIETDGGRFYALLKGENVIQSKISRVDGNVSW